MSIESEPEKFLVGGKDIREFSDIKSEAEKQEGQDEVIGSLLLQIWEVYKAAGKLERTAKFPTDTADLIHELCVALQTILEERLHSRHPEQHPDVTTADSNQYRHRDEAIGWLESVVEKLKRRDTRTIDVGAESEEVKKARKIDTK